MALIDGALLNDKALMRAFADIPDKLRLRVLRQAMREEFKPVLTDAKANAREISPRLAKSIKLRVLKMRSRDGLGLKIETGTRAELQIPAADRYYWPAALELGTRYIAPRAYMRNALKKHKGKMLSNVAATATRLVDIVIAAEIARKLKRG